jgi:hypothetical protein
MHLFASGVSLRNLKFLVSLLGFPGIAANVERLGAGGAKRRYLGKLNDPLAPNRLLCGAAFTLVLMFGSEVLLSVPMIRRTFQFATP